MHIGIDIRNLCTPTPSGVGYYSKELISRLITCEDVRWTLFASGSEKILQSIPKELLLPRDHITVHLLRHSNRLLNLKLYTGRITLDDLIASPIDAWFFPNIDFIRTEKPYIITAHDLSFSFLKECYSPKTRLWHHMVQPKRLYTDARALLSVSASTTQDLTSVFELKPQKIATIPLAADPNFCANVAPNDRHILLRYQIKGAYFLMLSTIEPRKNHLGVIAAYEKWRSEGGEAIPLIVAGQCGYKSSRVLRAIRKSPYRHDIHVIGYVAAEDRPTLMRHATALLFPSLYEGFALPIREAQQCGTPVLTSNTSAMLEHTGPSVLHVSPWHIQDIADGIKAIQQVPRAEKHNLPTRNWDDVAEETLQKLTSLLV